MTSKIAARYAKALFHSASKVQQKIILINLDDILIAYKKIPKFRPLLESPDISKTEKDAIIKKVFADKTDPLFLHFLSLLLEKGRFKHLPEIARVYRDVFTTTYGITDAHLVTATPLDDSTKEKLTNKLENIYQKKFDIEYDVNPQIIGGGVLVIEEKMIDFSIQGKLNKLKATLLA